MKTARIAFLVIGLMVVLSSCNTMHGFGKDVETAGDAIQRKSAK